MNISTQIKELRVCKKMTQLELAEKLGVSKATISAYENGTRLPSYDVLVKMAQLFQVSTDNILGSSQKYAIDVTELTQEQRNIISELVNTYKIVNSIKGE